MSVGGVEPPVAGASNVVGDVDSRTRIWAKIRELPPPPGSETDDRLSLSYEIVINSAEMAALLRGDNDDVVESLQERVERAGLWRVVLPVLLRADDKERGSGLDCLCRHPALDWALDAQGALNRGMSEEDLKSGLRMPLITLLLRTKASSGLREMVVERYSWYGSGMPHRYELADAQERLRGRPMSYGFVDDDEDFPPYEEF